VTKFFREKLQLQAIDTRDIGVVAAHSVQRHSVAANKCHHLPMVSGTNGADGVGVFQTVNLLPVRAGLTPDFYCKSGPTSLILLFLPPCVFYGGK